MKKITILDLFCYIALAGNGIYIFWIVYNGIDEGFQATRVQLVSSIGLLRLLSLNIFLLSRNAKRGNIP